MRRLVCALLVAGALVCGCSGGSSAAPSASAIDSVADASATLCESISDLAAVHESSVVPLSGDLSGADPDDYATVLGNADNLSRMITVIDVILEHQDDLAGLVFPADPDLVVATQNAYGSYGQGIVALNDFAKGQDADPVAALDQILEGQRYLETALDLVQRDSAAGTLSCQP